MYCAEKAKTAASCRKLDAQCTPCSHRRCNRSVAFRRTTFQAVQRAGNYISCAIACPSKTEPATRYKQRSVKVKGLTADRPTKFALVTSDDEARYYKEVEERDPELNAPAPADFYQLLGLEVDAPTLAVRSAYRALQRIVHPDIAGDTANDVASLLNSAYATLADYNARAAYDAELKKFNTEVGTFDGRPVSRWNGHSGEQRAVFVDESECVGCKQCVGWAPNTFQLEEEYGRARVKTQWGDDEQVIQEAIEMCPVDCISMVQRRQLALLEFVMKFCKREDVAMMGRRRSGNLSPSPGSENPFVRAEVFLRHRESAEVATEGSVKRVQDAALAAAIARAWLRLPREVRAQGWPDWAAAYDQAQQHKYGTTGSYMEHI